MRKIVRRLSVLAGLLMSLTASAVDTLTKIRDTQTIVMLNDRSNVRALNKFCTPLRCP